jgi:regulatory protein
VKIKHALKQKQVSDWCINKALQQIDEHEYENQLRRHAQKKWQTLSREKNIFIKRRKLLDHLLQKGFESDLCRDIIEEVEQTTK